MRSLTKEEKQGLMQGLGGSLVFSIILYLFTKDFVFALALPFGFYLLWTVMSMAIGQSWQVRLNNEEAVFRRPAAARAVYGVWTLAMGGIIAEWVHLCLPGRHPQDTGIGIFGLVFLLLVEMVFLLGTGPMDTRFEFGKGRVFYRTGFPLLSRTRSADKSEIACLRVTISSRRGSSVYLKWKGKGRHSGSIAQFGTVEEARAVAEQIGSRLALPVEVRDLRSVGG